MVSFQPRITVVVPTYNRAAILRKTLRALANQRFDGDYEVVVSDDGSSDDSRQVAAGFADRLRLKYHFQDDLGFRVAEARNAGARLAAAPLLAFVDAGILPGPDFVAAHVAEHAGSGGPGRAVIGYTFGYQPGGSAAGLAEALDVMSPEQVVRFYGDTPSFRDARHSAFALHGFDLGRGVLPWQLFWSINCSVPAADFWAVGGFDETFRGWGAEDLEFGFRLARRGLQFAVTRDGWAVDTPHRRGTAGVSGANRGNILTFLHRHPEPVVEMLWAWFMRDRPWFEGGHSWYVDFEYPAFLDAVSTSRALDVTAELAALRAVPTGRAVVFGCGGTLPAGLPPATLVDFDRELLAALPDDPRFPTHHAIGIRTTLPDDAFDVVLITSRLAGLWATWRPFILDEARRVGREVRGPLVGPGRETTGAPVGSGSVGSGSVGSGSVGPSGQQAGQVYR
jgi:glycosyltransferase involved in cell wall biosynthesis